MNAQDVLREYARLNRARKDGGVTPLEYLRWQDLKSKLEKAFPGRPAPGSGGIVRVTTHFVDREELASCVMGNLKPLGLFVRTPFAPEQGERFELHVTLGDREGDFDGSVTVASNNVGPEFSTVDMGMGVRLNDHGKLFQLLTQLGKVHPPRA